MSGSFFDGDIQNPLKFNMFKLNISFLYLHLSQDQ